MNKKLLLFLSIICISLVSIKANAKIIEKLVSEGASVEQKVLVRPGFGTFIKFPDVVTNAILADKAFFSCEPSAKKIVCTTKADTAGASTNLNVTTPRNDYILTLIRTDRDFYDGIVFELADPPEKNFGTRKSTDPLIKSFLKAFETRDLKASNSNEALKFNISKYIHLGDRFLFLVSAENLSDESVTLSDIKVFATSYANLTGLPIKTSEIHGVEFTFTKSTLGEKEKTEGVLNMRALNMTGGEDVSFKLIAEGSKKYEISVNHVGL